MNENKANYAKIGFFILSGMALILLAVAIAGARVIRSEVVLAETYFTESVTGLDVGSAVKYRGVPVGTVKEIGFVYTEYEKKQESLPTQDNMRQILVLISLDPKKFGLLDNPNPQQMLEHLVNQGLRVKLSSSGVTGLSFLELDYFEGGQPNMVPFDWRPHHPFIPSISSTMTTIKKAFDDVFVKLSKINYQGLGEKVSAVLDLATNRLAAVDVEGVSRQAVGLLGELRESNAALRTILSDPRWSGMAGQLSNTAERVIGLLEASRRDVDSLTAKYGGVADKTAGLVDNASRLIATNAAAVSGIAESLGQTSQSLNRTVRTQEDTIAELLENLRDASLHLNLFVKELSANPGSLLFGRPPPPLKEAP